MFVPDEVALEVLRLIDGARSVAAIADDLAARFAAPREEILADVTEMLADLAEKGVVAT
jgi:pyrroloquinoline quinone biosynthesis protein D